MIYHVVIRLGIELGMPKSTPMHTQEAGIITKLKILIIGVMIEQVIL